MRDYLLKGTSPTLRFALVNCTAAAECARTRWCLASSSSTTLLSKALASACLLASFLKDEERVQLHWVARDAAAPVSEVYTEALPIGEVRGYLRSGSSSSGAAQQGGLAGLGTFSVRKALYGARQYQQSTVEFEDGDIASEVQRYYAQSEQRAASLSLDAALEPGSGRVAWCTGMLLEAIPSEGGIAPQLQGGGGGAASDFDSLARRMAAPQAWPAGVEPAAAAAALAPALAFARRVPVDYFCRCTTANFLSKLVQSCSPDLLQQMLQEAEGGVAATLTCSFCNKVHAIGKEALHKQMEASK